MGLLNYIVLNILYGVINYIGLNILYGVTKLYMA